MSWLTPRSWTDELQDDFARHLKALRREVGDFGGRAGRYARDEAHELGDALMHSGALAARELGRQAKRTGKAIQRNPGPAIAGAIALACLASVLMGSGKSRR